MRTSLHAIAALALTAATPAAAQPNLQAQVEAKLAEAKPGTRFGLVVLDAEGRRLVSVNSEQRFIPASNTKMFTTAAAYLAFDGMEEPDAWGGAAVRIDGKDVVLIGNGDARLSSAADCVENCLASLADAVAAKTRSVRHVTGDDSLFPDERWSPGMSWNNIETRSGTGISALSLDNNEAVVMVSPGAVGADALVGPSYYRIDNRVRTVASGVTSIGYDRMPGSDVLRLRGTIVAGAEPQVIRAGIDDPAHYAATRMKQLLEARGVRVTGDVEVRHRPLGPADDPVGRGAAPAMRPVQDKWIARLIPPPLGSDIAEINKVSQNMHAELLLRRIGRVSGTGSIADGQQAVQAMLSEAGVPRTAYDFSDGSGMSTYNRVSPTGMTTFLRWVERQPWGAAYRASLPVGGSDGTLKNRFKDGPLTGKVHAKTGTINATNALSGWMTAKSGQTLTFAFFANDVPEGGSATAVMDAALTLIAEAH